MSVRLKPLEAIIISLSLFGEVASIGSVVYSSVNYVSLIKQAKEVEENNSFPEIKESQLRPDDKVKFDKYNQNFKEIKSLRVDASNYLIYGLASIGIALASGAFLYTGIKKRRDRLSRHWPY